MKVIQLLYLTCARAYYGWALREIDPMSEDVPDLVVRLHDLAVQQRRLLP